LRRSFINLSVNKCAKVCFIKSKPSDREKLEAWEWNEKAFKKLNELREKKSECVKHFQHDNKESSD
jgi:hypothetical protein